MSLNLEDLYDKYNILADAKDKVSEHVKDYLDCIEGTKGNEKEKQLAAQILSKFFKHFPEYQDKALNSILDLCEDDDSKIRTAAMKVLPLICKDSKTHVYKVADILAQLLQLDDQEHVVACNSLTQVFKEDPVNVTRAIFNHIHETNEDKVRQRCVAFLFKKLIKSQEKISPELEDLLIEEGKKTIPESSSDEFEILINYLTTSKLAKTIAGQKEIIELVSERAEIDQEFESFEEDNYVDRILMCIQSVLSLFSSNIESTKFVIYYCDQILPHWQAIENLDRGKELQLHILRQLAELSTHCGKLDNASLHVVQIFDKIKLYMPPPPENVDVEDMPHFDFTAVECLLFAFHRLARQCPDFLTSDPQVLKDFRARLTYFSRGVQGCKKSLEKNIPSQADFDKDSKTKLKIAPIVLNNINSLIKDLFYQPPIYKCNVTLSFKIQDSTKKKPAAAPEKTVTNKRHIPITFDGDNSSNKQARTNRGGDNMKLYTPPSGKFSNKFQFDRSEPRGRGRGRGFVRGSRGRGSSRGWRN